MGCTAHPIHSCNFQVIVAKLLQLGMSAQASVTVEAASIRLQTLLKRAYAPGERTRKTSRTEGARAMLRSPVLHAAANAKARREAMAILDKEKADELSVVVQREVAALRQNMEAEAQLRNQAMEREVGEVKAQLEAALRTLGGGVKDALTCSSECETQMTVCHVESRKSQQSASH
eukprot:SAG11_NODE_7016_length_1207_cov_4.184116_2_plen_175_part_00